mgnify:CR=1 FL=1
MVKSLAMAVSERTIELLAGLKRELQGEIDRCAHLSDRLAVLPPARPPVPLEQLDDTELDREMGTRLSALNDAIDFRPWLQGLSSGQSVKGRMVDCLRRRVFLLLAPLHDRQVRFAEQLVAFHLASFLRLRRIETRLNALERELLEQGHLPPPADDSDPTP